MASRRSSASSSSISKSALRVTRKRWCSSISMPENSVSRLASMTWSMQDEARRLDLDEARQDLRHLDPGEAALAGLRVAQADRDRQATASRCTGTGARDRPRAASGPGRSRRGSAGGAPRDAPGSRRSRRARCPRPRAPGGPTRRSPSGRRRARGRASRTAASCSSAVRPSGERATLPASTCWRSPATRTWKNSSRLPAKMARNLTRSSSGLRSSRASCRTRALNSSQDSSRLR